MKIKGYTPVDQKIATEIGIECEYPTEFGKIHIRLKFAGDENIALQGALKELERSNKISKLSTEEEFKSRVGIWHDHCVIKWATDIVDETTDKPIASTRENFVELLSTGPLRAVFVALVEDTSDYKKFQAEEIEAISKN